MTPSGPNELWELLRARVGLAELRWLEDAVENVGRDSSALAKLFPAVGRHTGRQPLRPMLEELTTARHGTTDSRVQASGSDPIGRHAPTAVDAAVVERGWTVDDAGRALLLLSAGGGVWGELEDLYRFGDAAERRAVLRSLALLPRADATTPVPGTEDVGLKLVEDAIRSNDPRLILAALGPYALERLDEDALNQAVLKCVFVGVPLTALDGVAERTSPSLSRMLAGYMLERVAAGRDVTPDIWPLIDAHPPEDLIAGIEAELEHPVEARRSAAEAALAQRAEHRPAPAERNGGTKQASRET